MRRKVVKAQETLLKKYEAKILPGPLNGKIVLGFCYYVSGPIALQNLASQGALVIKIERKPFGDPTRKVFSPDLFNSLTYGQLSVGLDYENDRDVALLKKLFQIAHVIVDNRSVRAKDNDAILQEYLRNPGKYQPKIYCSINAFSNKRWPGVDASVQAATGFAYTNCASEERPMKVGAPILDIVTGLKAAYAIATNLVYLQNRPSNVKNNLINISVSLAGISVWLQTAQMIDAVSGNEYFRSGNEDRFAAPFSYYTARDGYISIATVNESQFEIFCRNILKDESFHEKYPNIKYRVENQKAFENELNIKLKRETRDYWLAECKRFGLPASPVLTATEAIKQDYVAPLIATSTDGRRIVTAGSKNSMFPISERPSAPNLDEDHTIIEGLLTNIDPLSLG